MPWVNGHPRLTTTLCSGTQRPFANYYGLAFVLYELSTPFLNAHWFLDKLGRTGSTPQLLNGIALIVSFAGCRLVWGTYLSVRIYADLWRAVRLRFDPITLVGRATDLASAVRTVAAGARDGGGLEGMAAAAGTAWEQGQETWAAQHVPLGLAGVYLAGNTLLMGLNVYWFGKMVEALRKRFPGEKEKEVDGAAKQPGAGRVTRSNQEGKKRR